MDKNLFVDPVNKMYCYKTTKIDLDTAEAEFQARFNKTNIINKKTVYDRKESRIAGILGEIVFKNLYPAATKSKDLTYDFDYDGLKIDVKCKYRKVRPVDDFQASFFMYQANKGFNADVYYFMSTIRSFGYVWLCGTISKNNIMNNSNKEIWKAGQIDEANGMVFKEDTICLKYRYLDKVVIPSN